MPDLQPLILKLTSGDDEVAEAAVEQFAALGETALPALFDLLDSSDPEERWWALYALAMIPHPQVPPRLQEMLYDSDPAVRQCAALGLSQQPTIETISNLIALLEDGDRLLARLAGDALIAVGSPALLALIATLETGPQPAKIEATRALALIGDKEAISALFKAWQDGSTMIQHWAEEGLDRMGIGMQFFTPDG
jgi:HEAT repeat protein